MREGQPIFRLALFAFFSGTLSCKKPSDPRTEPLRILLQEVTVAFAEMHNRIKRTQTDDELIVVLSEYTAKINGFTKRKEEILGPNVVLTPDELRQFRGALQPEVDRFRSEAIALRATIIDLKWHEKTSEKNRKFAGAVRDFFKALTYLSKNTR
ncbi:MAG: hypothetical protein JNJ69_14765 [Leptospiraceae bacterium]|nr:hypothetical protein [Leptospiraceae bacterium]